MSRPNYIFENSHKSLKYVTLLYFVACVTSDRSWQLWNHTKQWEKLTLKLCLGKARWANVWKHECNAPVTTARLKSMRLYLSSSTNTDLWRHRKITFCNWNSNIFNWNNCLEENEHFLKELQRWPYLNPWLWLDFIVIWQSQPFK